MKIWERQKSMKKGTYNHNLTPRDKFSMGKPHPTLSHACLGARTPDLPSLPLSSHRPQSHSRLVPERITDGCMTMAKPLKPDLGYHYTSVRKIPRGLDVTH